ncbi:hypothetical protein R8871_06352 [Paraburkholderia graminis C4D1M]|uniref:AAA ATPase n=1 Tax=Paraburkholderia graminis (strain ATCC 700544 / DSM 17151 / LMG 18924 / NCIMB 13744 / C4D1M) TaxID=396598 RepID=B1GB67_PARG4|nr:hypothetical protein [Paraburkholderia graminis]EDT06628.1 conserved hypothetical protein [Paraburkholderia graminis C4D1M]CAB3737701.1 hypothetical protein R8871_06352 [Paraburkholderia graminis C4D1M]
MSLPDIDFKKIRVHRTSQADAFEELCCQLAGDEPLTDRIRFDKKGRGGDGGIECFATHADGSETGWQVKFYWEIDSLLSSLDGSLTKALVKHPDMHRFIACFPFDLADSRRADVTTAFAKWTKWRERRISEAAAAGRTVAIDRWDAHEIKQRLTDSNTRSAGRIAFWFDQELLTADWFRKAFERTADTLGDRYSPQTHIDIPVRQSILATVRDPVIFKALKPLAARIRHSLQQTPDSANNAARTAALGVATELDTLADEQPDSFPLLELRGRIDAAADLATAWHGELRDQRQGRERSPELIAVSNLMNALRACARNVRADHWTHLDTRALLVSGDAGSGKSHLLADACAHQIENGRPAMMVLGGKLPDAEPWGEILRDLDLPRHLQVGQFLGALNAAGEAADVRALVVIDALNEKNGQLIWPERLAGLLNDVRQFPWITVVLSCRTTYLDVVIPDTLDPSKLPRIEHEGFDDEDVMRYLHRRGISVPEAPRQLDELHNPLFLRLACDALNSEGEVLMTESLSGISEAFRLFTSAVTRRIEATTKVSPHRKLVSKAIEALTTEMSRTGRGEVGFERADELVRSIYDGNEIASDMLFQLESEGLLAVEQDSFSSVESREVVRFTFERMGDHAIAASLLNGSMTSEGAGAVCAPGTPLHQALADRHSRIVPGLLEALAIQLPERLDLELPDLADIPSRSWVDEAFVQSLLARRPTAFRDRTWQLVAEMGDERLRFDTLIALSAEPEHPFNVRVLDSELRCLAMPQRDAQWSVHLADSDRATTLVDWVWNADQKRVTFARAELAAIQLTWFLTTSFRPLRDRATKALVALLAGRPRLAISLWSGFKNVDDGYLTERLIAALYGAAMQGVWEDHDLSAVAMTLYRDLFANRTPPANSLLRDHALGLIAYAMHRGVTSSAIDPEKLNGPFLSPWPIEHVPDETIAGYTRQHGDNGRFPDEIVNSCQDGDFGRYVLDYAVQDWSPALAGTSPLPNALDLRNTWFEEFKVTATPDMIAAHDRLVDTLASENPRNTAVVGEARGRVRAAKAVFRAAVGPDMFEEWRERAEYWRAEGIYQSYASQSGPVGFNLAWARRWVVKRAHDLGWSEELHGAFDRQIRGDRNEHSLERIGKKYQWLALYELVARMSDNLERLPDRDTDPLRLRNLDPSLLVDHVAADDWEEVPAKPFWIGAAPELAARTPAEAITWLHSSEDILDGVENVAVRCEDDDRHWLVLTGFKTWRTPTQGMHCEAWRRVACVVVRAVDRDTTLELMSAGQMTGPHDVPTAAGGGYRVHLGEFPWRSLAEERDDWILDWRPVNRSGRRGNRLAIRPTTTEYNAEADGYDGSVSDHINLHLPARWLMDGLGLHLTDGRSIMYQDAQGVTRFMDPSVSTVGESAALVDRDAFLRLLEREGLVAIWTVAGEKNAYGDSAGDGFGGRLTFTRLFYSDGSGLRGRDRLETFDAPSARQRAAFLGESADAGQADDEPSDVTVSHSLGHGNH